MDSETFLMEITLKRITLTTVMINLWNTADIRLLIQTHVPNNYRAWKKIEDQVQEKVWALPLPQTLHRDLLQQVYPIGYQIKCWWEMHHLDHHYVEALPAQLCWTPLGLLNARETAKTVFVDDEERDVIFRYKLACKYCMSEKILELWKCLPVERQRRFYGSGVDSDEYDPMVHMWTKHIRRCEQGRAVHGQHEMTTEELTRSRFAYLFTVSVENGNLWATRFFFEILPPEIKAECLLSCHKQWRPLYKSGELHVIFYLLSRMNAAQQRQPLKSCYHFVLKHALKWAWYDFFLGLVNRTWDYMSREKYLWYVRYMIEYTLPRTKFDDDSRRLFIDFWQQSPPHYHTFVLKESFYWLCRQLHAKLQVEILRVIYAEASIEQKLSIVFNDLGMYVCRRLISREE